MYKPIRENLKVLYREFQRASAQFPPLYHDLFFDLSIGERLITCDAETIYKRALEETANQDSMAAGHFAKAPHALESHRRLHWQKWYGPCKTFSLLSGDWFSPNMAQPEIHEIAGGKWYGHFYGSHEGLDEFMRLAESTQIVIAELKDLHFFKEDRKESWQTFVELLHRIAFEYPTPLLRIELLMSRWWNDAWIDAPSSATETDQPEDCPERPADMEYAIVHRLRSGLFSASMEFLRMLLHPDHTLLIGPDDIERGPAFRWLEHVQDVEAGNPSLRADEEDADERIHDKRTDHQPLVAQIIKATLSDSPESPRTALPQSSFVFRRMGEIWQLRFGVGDKTDPVSLFKDSVGLNYLAEIIRRKGDPVPFLDLAILGDKARPEDVEAMQQRMSDHQSDTEEERSGQMKSRQIDPTELESKRHADELIRQLKDKLQIAKETHSGNEAEIEEQLRKARQMRNVLGYRKNLGSKMATPAEKAKNRVRVSLHRCCNSIAGEMPQFAKHLKDSLETHASVSIIYRPNPDIVWQLD